MFVPTSTPSCHLLLAHYRAGSGRGSLTQLATSMAGAVLVRVCVTHDYGMLKFEEDLKRAVLVAGIEDKHVVFLLKDSQVGKTFSLRGSLEKVQQFQPLPYHRMRCPVQLG